MNLRISSQKLGDPVLRPFLQVYCLISPFHSFFQVDLSGMVQLFVLGDLVLKEQQL